MSKFFRRIVVLLVLISIIGEASAQVNAVTFGKNRMQYKKRNWQYYQTDNFNVFFYENGKELAKYILQIAEKELPQIESATEYSLQRRANIIVYNDYEDMRNTNIGLETMVFNTGGYTKLVDNKLVVYFDANHEHLKRQVRQGIADVLTKNILFGEDIGEVASNQNLLDMPQWLVDGYISYIGENWSVQLDDDLRSEVLSGNYSKFKSFAFERPDLAGHAFWYFVEEKYKKENVTYFFYLMRSYKNLDRASMQITGKKFKELQEEFMEYEDNKYSQDIRKRKAYPKGNTVESFDINKRQNYYRFNVNPQKRNNSYVTTRYKKGIVSVIYNDSYTDKTLLKYGILTYENEINPNYPLLSWDPKGTRITVIYKTKGRLKLFVYDAEKNTKIFNTDLTDKLDQVQDIQYMYDKNVMLFSAVKNGHTDIYTYNVLTDKLVQVTNDVYDDIDASFVTFPNKTGIMFASNRPGPMVKGGDTSLPTNNRYNVFLITDFGDKPEFNQVTQLTNLKYGTARFPTQYNMDHFTFVNDENGIMNRYAGFFNAIALGFDTLVVIGDDILRNPSQGLIDSTLTLNNRTQPDTVAVVSMTADSAFVFPISNYPANLAESRIAGDNDQVSEVVRQSDSKTLYKLKIDKAALERRNISTPPTAYGKKRMRESDLTKVQVAGVENSASPIVDTTKSKEEFQSEFARDTVAAPSILPAQVVVEDINAANAEVLKNAKLYTYKPGKWGATFGSAGVNGSPIFNRYQTFTGSGPINLSSNTPLNAMIQLGTSELLEDYRINGAFKIGTNLKDNEWFVSFQNLRRRVDWGLTYYRNVFGMQYEDPNDRYIKPAKNFTNLYQANITYPFNEASSLRLTAGFRSERVALLTVDSFSARYNDYHPKYMVSKMEYVYDNTLNPANNIWQGLRGKVYGEWNREVSKDQTGFKPNMFNIGMDVRYYYPIFRNFTWAGRVAADFSLGDQRVAYFLGGMDGWLTFGSNQVVRKGVAKERYFNSKTPVAQDERYTFQTLAVNMRGYIQNLANGNNNIVINSEFRLPILSTFFDKTVNNALINNFMITQFIDLGTAWNGKYNAIKRPTTVIANNDNSVVVKLPAGGIGPFAGGYGFGARSSLFGYYLKFDAGWPMTGFFQGKPVMYLSLGFDF